MGGSENTGLQESINDTLSEEVFGVVYPLREARKWWKATGRNLGRNEPMRVSGGEKEIR